MNLTLQSHATSTPLSNVNTDFSDILIQPVKCRYGAKRKLKFNPSGQCLNSSFRDELIADSENRERLQAEKEERVATRRANAEEKRQGVLARRKAAEEKRRMKKGKSNR